MTGLQEKMKKADDIISRYQNALHVLASEQTGLD